MHSISTLRKELGLTTTNQVRNRIEAVKDLLHAHIRRGPNNQILVTDEGLELLRRLQELHDSGLTIGEASGVMRSDSLIKHETQHPVSQRLPSFDTKPSQTDVPPPLQAEIAQLRRSIASLEAIIRSQRASSSSATEPWWIALREEIDVP